MLNMSDYITLNVNIRVANVAVGCKNSCFLHVTQARKCCFFINIYFLYVMVTEALALDDAVLNDINLCPWCHPTPAT